MSNRKQKIQGFMEDFRLLRRLLAFKPFTSDKLHRITPAQLDVLMILESEGEYTIKDVARALRISSSAATQLVDGLVGGGYVIRTEHGVDRRKVTLTFSSKAKKELAAMQDAARKQFLVLFDVLNDEEFEQFMHLHAKIIERHSKTERFNFQ